MSSAHQVLNNCNCNFTFIWLKRSLPSRLTAVYRKHKTNSKRDYYNLITSPIDEQGAFFSILDHLFHNTNDLILPTHDCPDTLASEFTSFFVEKVDKILSFLNIPVCLHSLNPFPEPLHHLPLRLSFPSPSKMSVTSSLLSNQITCLWSDSS